MSPVVDECSVVVRASSAVVRADEGAGGPDVIRSSNRAQNVIRYSNYIFSECTQWGGMYIYAHAPSNPVHTSTVRHMMWYVRPSITIYKGYGTYRYIR